MKTYLKSCLFGAAALLVACSGSSSDPVVPPPPPPPVITVSVDPSAASVDEGQPFYIDASGSAQSDGDALTFKIEQTGGPDLSEPPADFDVPDRDGVFAFAVPELDADETISFTVTVTSGSDSASGTVELTGKNIELTPVSSRTMVVSKTIENVQHVYSSFRSFGAGRYVTRLILGDPFRFVKVSPDSRSIPDLTLELPIAEASAQAGLWDLAWIYNDGYADRPYTAFFTFETENRLFTFASDIELDAPCGITNFNRGPTYIPRRSGGFYLMAYPEELLAYSELNSDWVQLAYEQGDYCGSFSRGSLAWLGPANYVYVVKNQTTGMLDVFHQTADDSFGTNLVVEQLSSIDAALGDAESYTIGRLEYDAATGVSFDVVSVSTDGVINATRVEGGAVVSSEAFTLNLPNDVDVLSARFVGPDTAYDFFTVYILTTDGQHDGRHAYTIFQLDNDLTSYRSSFEWNKGVPIETFSQGEVYLQSAPFRLIIDAARENKTSPYVVSGGSYIETELGVTTAENYVLHYGDKEKLVFYSDE